MAPKHRLSDEHNQIITDLSNQYKISRSRILTEALGKWATEQRQKDTYGAKLGDEWPGLSFSRNKLFWGNKEVELVFTRRNINPEIHLVDPFFSRHFVLGWSYFGAFAPNDTDIAELVSMYDVEAPADRGLTIEEARQYRMFAAIQTAAKYEMEVRLG